jgi:mRNA-degrading endonuclease YafQ of YafQ-DinJ toxin-antitoxin module
MNLPNKVDGALYRPEYTEEFVERCEDKSCREHQRLILQTVERICRQPRHQSHLLDNKDGRDWQGRRDRHVKDGDLVIIFAWCGECAEQDFRGKGFLDCCDGDVASHPDCIIFLTVGPHKKLLG